MTTLNEALVAFEPERFEQTRDSRSVLQSMAGFALRAFSPMPTSAPEYVSEHFDHSDKRNDPNPQFDGKTI